MVIYMLFTLILLIVPSYGAPKEDELQLAQPCIADSCHLPDCRCISTEVPDLLSPTEIPQLVLLTFDDAVSTQNYPYYEEAFFSRTNPDGCPIGTTYFVSHEYTDYSLVHNLHARGHEIASHSISHETSITYWDELSLDGYMDEFGGARTIASYFGNIPEEDITGIRVPFLQLAGNMSFHALKLLGMVYDSSWPTQTYMDPPLWPYSLDYASSQDCPVGVCPTASLPGVWVQPMVDWTDDDGTICSMVDSCVNIPEEAEELKEFMVRNFNRHYESNKAPFGFYVHAAWFTRSPANFEAYKYFLDYLQEKNDVYIVTVQRALEWVRNPTTLGSLKDLWPECQKTYTPTCSPLTCELHKGDEFRYMTHCRSSCPHNYPWLGNHLGQ